MTYTHCSTVRGPFHHIFSDCIDLVVLLDNVLQQMVELFEDSEQDGYFMTASDGETLIARPKDTYDGAIPSGNSVAAMVLQRLTLLTGEGKWQDAAGCQMFFLANAIWDYPRSSCLGVLAMMDALYPHWELVCCTLGKPFFHRNTGCISRKNGAAPQKMSAA